MNTWKMRSSFTVKNDSENRYLNHPVKREVPPEIGHPFLFSVLVSEIGIAFPISENKISVLWNCVT